MATVPDKNLQSTEVQSSSELVLLGIEKVWVKTKNGWVDKAKLELHTQPVTTEIQEDNFTPERTRKWWQFWK